MGVGMALPSFSLVFGELLDEFTVDPDEQKELEEEYAAGLFAGILTLPPLRALVVMLPLLTRALFVVCLC
jgi:hypothetical protein